MSDQITSYIRTLTPTLVGALMAWLTQKGINVPPELVAATTALLTTLFGMLYYVIARKLEARWPQFGWLLGVAKMPEYK